MSIDERTRLEAELQEQSDPALRLRNLLRLAFLCSRTEPDQGLQYSEEALALSRRLDDLSAESEILRSRAWCYDTKADYQAALSNAEEALRVAELVEDGLSMASCYNVLGVICCAMRAYARALESLDLAYLHYEKMSDAPGMASASNNLGMAYQAVARYPEAAEAYLRALRINEERGDELQAATNIVNLSNIYYYMGDFERSFNYDMRSLEVARRHGNLYNTAHVLDSIASNYRQQSKYREALQALDEALELFCRIGERRYEASVRIKRASTLESLGETSQAMLEYQAAIECAAGIGRTEIEANALFHLGYLHRGQENNSKALEILEQALELALGSQGSTIVTELHKVLAECLAALGRHSDAYRHLSQHLVLAMEQVGADRQRAIAELQTRFDLERAQQERELLRLKNQQLEERMTQRSAELNAMALRLVQKNSVLEKLRKEVTKLSAQVPDAAVQLNQMAEVVGSNLRHVSEWDQFEHEFQSMHHEFLERLSREYPQLTPTERKVCAMMKQQLSNKQMASLLSISLRSVETHRYAIRKKLHLGSEQNLSTAISAL